MEGLFGEARRGTYELFRWDPQGAEVRGWAGRRVWLVPEDEAFGPWLLEDVESLGRHRGADSTPGAWADLDSRQRLSWLETVRERACRREHQDRPANHAYELDGRHITDVPSLYLALGEAVNGPGGYFGGCLDALDDCLRGTFGYTGPATLLWPNVTTAREHLSRALTPDGRPYDLFTEVLNTLAQGGMDVTLA